jgi:Zn-dependent protease
MFIELLTTNPQHYFSWIGFAIFSICVHESAHARVAVHFGDETPRDYILLNPFKQMGKLSIGLLCIIGIAWGAVPVNPHGCGSRWRNAMVYLAGPLSNLALCAIFALLAQTARLWDADNLSQTFQYGSYVNGALCLLNLCPVPPLDGFGVIRSLITQDIQVQTALNKFAGIGLLILWMTPAGSMLFTYGRRMADLFSDLWILPFQLMS